MKLILVSDDTPTGGEDDEGWPGPFLDLRVRSHDRGDPSRTATSFGVRPEVAAASCYLLVPLAGLVVLGLEEEDPYVRFHGVQSLLYGAATASTWVVTVCARALFPAAAPGSGAYVLFPAGFLAGICLLAYGPYAAERSLRGEHHRIPYLGRYAAERA